MRRWPGPRFPGFCRAGAGPGVLPLPRPASCLRAWLCTWEFVGDTRQNFTQVGSPPGSHTWPSSCSAVPLGALITTPPSPAQAPFRVLPICTQPIPFRTCRRSETPGYPEAPPQAIAFQAQAILSSSGPQLIATHHSVHFYPASLSLQGSEGSEIGKALHMTPFLEREINITLLKSPIPGNWPRRRWCAEEARGRA